MEARSDTRRDYLSDAERAYYLRIESILDSDDFDEDDTDIFSSNFIGQVVQDNVKKVFTDPIGSRVLQRIVMHCRLEEDKASTVLETILENFTEICSNKYGSHSLETFLLEVFLPRRSSRSNPPSGHLEERLVSCYALTKENIGVHLTCPYASHVLRCLLQVLSGLRLSEEILRSKVSAQYCSRKMPSAAVGGAGRPSSSGYVVARGDVPEGRLLRLEKFGKKLCKLQDLEYMLVDPNASPVLQAAVIVLVEVLPERGAKLMKKVIKCIGKLSGGGEGVSEGTARKECDELSPVFTDPIGSHMIEVMMEVVPPHLRESLLSSYIQGHVMDLALDPVANYTLQHFITTATEEQVSAVMEELSLEDVLYSGHLGVIVKLSQTCVHMGSLQSRFKSALLHALGMADQPKKALPALFTLSISDDPPKPPAKQDDTGDGGESNVALTTITLHGSLLVQNLLKFEDSRWITSSIVGLPLPTLMHLACHTNGSHVLEVLLSSKVVDIKKKKKMVDKFKGTYCQLCCNKSGSRVVDACWKHSDIDTKGQLAEELLVQEEELKNDHYGKFVLRNCHIDSFKRKQGKWKERQQAAEKTIALFDDILKDSPAGDGQTKKPSLGKKRGSLVSLANHGKMDDTFAEENGKPQSKKIPLF